MKKHIHAVRLWLVFFMVSLFISGATAIPLETETGMLLRLFPHGQAATWFTKVQQGLAHTRVHFPFLNYGYDWLAFAHFILAILFIGPYRDPVRNKWVIEFGIIACLLIIPFAFVAGYFRDISIEWRLIDCSFGVVGVVPLLLIRNRIIKMEKLPKPHAGDDNPFISFHRIRISANTNTTPIEYLN